MSILNSIQTLAQQHVEETAVDMNVAQKGGGSGSRLLPVGNALARLVGYIELGNQEGTGKAAGKIQPMCRLTFALFGQTPSGEAYHNEDGTPAIRSTFDMNLSLNEKATLFKLFKKMNPKGDKKHFAQMINDTFILPVTHTKDAKDATKVYANLDLDNIRAAVDPITYQPYPVPEIKDDKLFKLFLWDNPTKECWDSIFIEGTNDDGKSKNYLQERILGAVNYPGSALEQLLGGAGSLPPLPTASAGPVETAQPEAGQVQESPSEVAAMATVDSLALPMV